MKANFIRFAFFSTFLAAAVLLAGCTPMSEDSGARGDTNSFGSGSSENGNTLPSLEREIAGNYSNGIYLITLKSNKTGDIKKVGGNTPPARNASGGTLPTGNFTWSVFGTTVSIKIISTRQELAADYSASSDPQVITIEGVNYNKLPSMDDSDYTPPTYVPVTGNYSATIKANAFFGSVMHPAIKGGESVNVPLKYVIVADSQFENVLQKYIKHKRKQGFNVVEIYRNAGETAEQLRQKIIDEHYAKAAAANPAPAYVLLCGDHENLPAFRAQTLDLGKPYYTDYHYGEYNNDWIQEAMVGRFSAKTTDELEAQIDKTMYMELNGGTNEYLSVGMKDADQSQWVSDYVANAGANGGLVNWQPVTEITNRINSGVGFVFHAGHSGETYWTGEGGYGRSLDTVEAGKLTNTNNYPVFMSMSCYSATFAYHSIADCLGEALMKNPSGGAVGYIGATITSKAAVNPMVSQGWRNWDVSQNQATYTPDSLGAVAALYHSRGESRKYWARSMGEVLYSGIKAIELQYKDGAKGYLARRYHEIYVLLGDPSYMPYTQASQKATVTFVGQALTGRAVEITTVPYARLALTKENAQGKVDIIAVTVSDEFGRAVMNIPENAPVGEAVLSSIAQNYSMESQTVSIAVGVQPKDNDTTLAKLSVEKTGEAAIVIPLTDGKFEYECIVPYETKVLTVTAKANKNTSAVYGTGTVHLEVGDNDVEIEVVAEDMTAKTYNLKIVRKDTTKSRDYSIKTLKINDRTLSPRDSDKWYYDYHSGSNALLKVEVEMTDGNAKCWLQGDTDEKEAANKARATNKLSETVNLSAWNFGDVIYVRVQSEFADETYTFTIKLIR